MNSASSHLSPGAAERLLQVVQDLSTVRDLGAITAIVRKAARELTGADGATFVLRDGDRCYYADEDAIAPLWKGSRFSMAVCVSGWVMLQREAIAIEDIYADPRVPHDAYRPTFVQSLAMVPIRSASPIGAIGNYWATKRHVTPEEIALLQALANSTSIAMENVQLIETLEARVAERTEQLAAANRELETFSYAVAHELRTPIGHILGFGQLAKAQPELTPSTREHIADIEAGARKLNLLIEDLLKMAHLGRSEIESERVDLSAMAYDVAAELRERYPDRNVELDVEANLSAVGDRRLLRIVLDNLLGNAWKYVQRAAAPKVELGSTQIGARRCFFVRDNGVGFDQKHAPRLFTPFMRLHAESEFRGTGVGLSTVKRIVTRHGGNIWVESKPNIGTTFTWYVQDA